MERSEGHGARLSAAPRKIDPKGRVRGAVRGGGGYCMHAIMGPAGWLSLRIVFHSVRGVPLGMGYPSRDPLLGAAGSPFCSFSAIPSTHPNLQAVSRGLAGPFLIKLGSQPQIVSAYAPSAPVRAADLVQELAASLQSLQVWTSCVLPYRLAMSVTGCVCCLAPPATSLAMCPRPSSLVRHTFPLCGAPPAPIGRSGHCRPPPRCLRAQPQWRHR